MNNGTAHTLGDMLAGLEPALTAGMFVFASFPGAQVPAGAMEWALGWFREAEGISLILPRETALTLGCGDDPPMRRIVLQVNSSLEGVGLIAAVAGRLAEHGIACNVIAAFHHDHLFVPAGRADEALRLLGDLQREAG